MYADNPKKFSQLVGKQNRNTARAILFHMDDGFTMLGRIYCGSSYLTNMMEMYAKEKGWMYSCGYNGLKIKDEAVDLDDHDLTISGVKWHEGGVPYMDDFENASIQSDGTMTLYYNSNSDYILTECSGMVMDGVYCCCCDSGFSEDNAFNDDNGDVWCPSCFEEYFLTCEDCEETVHTDNVREVHQGVVCESCYDNHYVSCAQCGKYHHSDNTTTLYDGEEVCKTCLKEEYTLCEECEQYTKEETFMVTGCETVCKSCFDEYNLCEECEEYVKDTTSGEDDRELCEDCKEICYAETE
jgi:hypothetical protein